MGENPKYIYLTGSPSIDEVLANRVTKKKELENKYDIHFTGKEIIFLQHPVTTETEQTEKQIRNTLNAIVKIGNTTIAIAPNSDAGNRIIFQYLKKYSQKYPFIKTYRTLPRADFLGMLNNCSVLVGNSSSGIIEASYFAIPVINIGIRQEGRERGKNVIDVPTNSENLIYTAIIKGMKNKNMFANRRSYIYGSGNASKKIVKYLENIKLDKKLIQKQICY